VTRADAPPESRRAARRLTSPGKFVVGSVAILAWGLFFDDLARTGRWLLDTSYVNAFPLADLHSRYVDAHLAWAHSARFYSFRIGAFTYPPFAAYAFLPFHLIGFRATMTVWTVASMVALAGLFSISLHRWLSMPAADAWLLAAAALAPASVFVFYPLRSLLIWGQMAVLLMVIVFVDLFVVPRRFRGILIGAAAAIKLLPALFIVWLLARRDIASSVRVVATFILLTLFAAALWPHASEQYWFHVLPSGRDVQMAADPTHVLVTATRWIYGVGKLPNQSLRGMFGRPPFLWLGDLPWLPVAVGVLGGGIAVAVRLLREDRELAAFLVLSVTTVLVSPVSWLHYWSFVALAPLLVVIEWRRDRPLAIAAAVLAVATCANLENTNNLLFAPFTSMAPITVFVIRNLYVLGGMVFLATAAARAFRTSASETAPLAVS
jgi:alpha-1,2-mannosyltransferase